MAPHGTSWHVIAPMTAKSMQNHRESMRTLRGLHAFAVISPAIRFCKGAAKAWHLNAEKTFMLSAIVTSWSASS